MSKNKWTNMEGGASARSQEWEYKPWDYELSYKSLSSTNQKSKEEIWDLQT